MHGEKKNGKLRLLEFALASFFTEAASFWLYFPVKQGQDTDVTWPKPSPEEQQVKHCSKLLQRTVPAAFPSLPFQKDISQTRDKKALVAARHRTLGRRGEYN